MAAKPWISWTCINWICYRLNNPDEDVVIKPLFKKGPSIGARLTFIFFIAVGLILIGYKSRLLDPLKSTLLNISSPLYVLSDLPAKMGHWVESVTQTHTEAQLVNTQLSSEVLVLSGKLQKMNALKTENTRLRELLGAAQKIEHKLVLADVIAVSPGTVYHYVIINKGSAEGVQIGQALIDQDGLFGQVIEVGTHTSRVLLISDQQHGVPVEVNRNGLRGMIEGTNDYSVLIMPNVAVTSDIVEGDLLVTSGLGGIFPKGYPVARITRIFHPEGTGYLSIRAEPLAHLNFSRHLLLLFRN